MCLCVCACACACVKPTNKCLTRQGPEYGRISPRLRPKQAHPQPRPEMTSGRQPTQSHTCGRVTRRSRSAVERGTPSTPDSRDGAGRHSHRRDLRLLSLPVRELPEEVIGLFFLGMRRTRMRGFGRMRAMRARWGRRGFLLSGVSPTNGGHSAHGGGLRQRHGDDSGPGLDIVDCCPFRRVQQIG